MLSLLVYAAAESGAQQFIEMIFTSSAGRVVFDAYKGNASLPADIAKDHGNEKTANYLEEVTKRYVFYDNEEKGKLHLIYYNKCTSSLYSKTFHTNWTAREQSAIVVMYAHVSSNQSEA